MIEGEERGLSLKDFQNNNVQIELPGLVPVSKGLSIEDAETRVVEAAGARYMDHATNLFADKEELIKKLEAQGGVDLSDMSENQEITDEGLYFDRAAAVLALVLQWESNAEVARVVASGEYPGWLSELDHVMEELDGQERHKLAVVLLGIQPNEDSDIGKAIYDIQSKVESHGGWEMVSVPKLDSKTPATIGEHNLKLLLERVAAIAKP
jgi:hypothetical protein